MGSDSYQSPAPDWPNEAPLRLLIYRVSIQFRTLKLYDEYLNTLRAVSSIRVLKSYFLTLAGMANGIFPDRTPHLGQH